MTRISGLRPGLFLAAALLGTAAQLVYAADGSDALIAQSAPATPAPPATPPMPPRPPGPPGERGERDEHWGRHDPQAFTEKLALTPAQKSLWEAAMTKSRPTPEDMQRMRAEHDQIREAMHAPNADLRKLAAQIDQIKAEHDAHHKVVRDAWLALNDSLDARQREQVGGMVRMHVLGMGMPMGMQHGMHGDMGGDMRGGEMGPGMHRSAWRHHRHHGGWMHHAGWRHHHHRGWGDHDGWRARYTAWHHGPGHDGKDAPGVHPVPPAKP